MTTVITSVTTMEEAMMMKIFFSFFPFFFLALGNISWCQSEAKQVREGGNGGGICLEKNWRGVHSEEK